MSEFLERMPSTVTWEELARYLAITNKDPLVQKIVEILSRKMQEEVAERVAEERDPDFEDMEHMWIMAGIELSVGINELEQHLLAELRTVSYENMDDCVRAALKKFRHEQDPYND